MGWGQSPTALERRLSATVRCSSRLRKVVQDEQLCPRARRDRIGASLVVTELHQKCLVVKLFDDSADLAAREAMRGKVCKQSGHVQNGRPFVLCAFFCLHQSTQHVTNLGTASPVRTIQSVLTTALFFLVA